MSEPAPKAPWKALLGMLLAIALLAGLGASAIALERPVGRAEGQVLDEEGAPLAGAKVVASGPVTRTVHADANGRFAYHHLPVGSYYVSAKAPGHDPQYQESAVQVAEGETATDIDFRLAMTVPSVDVLNVQRVFTPSEPLRVNVRGNQLDALEVTLYRLDLAKAAAADPELTSLRVEKPATLLRRGLISAERTWRVPVAAHNREDENWFFQPVQVDGARPGAWLMTVAGQPSRDRRGRPRARVEDAWWYTVGELALVTKRSRGELLAWVSDMEKKAPVGGAEVRLFGTRGSLGKALTDVRGIARLPLPASEEKVLALAGKGGALALTRPGFYAEERRHDIYAFTDRPVYRPGQTVSYKAFVRRRTPDGFARPTASTVAIAVKDALGAELLKTDHALVDAGAFAGELRLPPDAALGEYRAEINVGKDWEYLNFQVADYRKPEFKVEIAPARPRVVMGETAEIGLTAGYYFGAPVPGARLNVTVHSAPRHWGAYDEDAAFFAGYTDDPGYEAVWGLGDVVQQEELVADGQGRARLRVPVPAPRSDDEGWTGDRVYTVAVEAMDAAGKPVKAQESFVVTQADVRLRVEADQALYAGGSALGVTVDVSDHDGKPLAREVAVQVVRLESVEKVSPEGDEYTETRRVPVYTGSVRTDARGLARLQIPSPGEGSFELVGEVRDERARVARDRAWAWVTAGEDGGASYRYGALRVLTDKKVYKPGDRAKVLVVSPVAGVSALVTVEGRRLHEARVVRLNGASALVEIPVREGYKPNAWIAAAIVNGKEYMEAERSLNVLPEDKFLQVVVKSDRPRAEPGEDVTYHVETRDWRGKPVDAEVALGVVDQAIYAIEPDRTPDIRGFFHGPRWNEVASAYSFAEDYSGGLDKFAPDPRIRARFEDTAAWFPAIRTGDDGHAVVRVTLPDNLTTWVATARAATADTRVGAASHRLLATKDLLVRLETPRFAVVGDRLLVSAIAHSYMDRPVEVDVALEARGLDLGQAGARRVTLQPGGSERVAWEALVPADGEARARVWARPVGAPGKGDAMELPIPALAFGTEDFSPLTATASPGRTAETSFEVPAGALPGARLALRPNTSPLPAIRTAIDYLHHYRYGCVEQTMSRFLPDAALQPRLAALGVPTAELFPNQEARLAEGVRLLAGFQHHDGGWGWWPEDASRPELTAYVLYGLAEARDAGAAIPTRTVARARERLRADVAATGKHVFTRRSARRLAGADVRAFMLYALARWDDAPAAELDRSVEHRAMLSSYGAAQLALALHQARDPRAATLADALRSGVSETETHAAWTGADEAFAWHDSTTEATSWALRALLAVHPDDPLVPKAARWLMSKNARGWWEDTKDTAAAAIALADYMAVRRPPVPGTTATFWLDERLLGRWSMDEAAPFATPPELAATVAPGQHRLRVELSGEAGDAPGGTLDVSGGVSFKRGAEGLPPSSAHGLTIERRYLRLPADVYARARGKGTAFAFDDELAASLRPLGGEVEAGERVLVQLTLRAERKLRWMAVSDPLPAGCEILEDQPDNHAAWWDHQEYRDEEAAFFFSELPPGTRSLYYVMRPTTPGRFRVLPPSAWAMYQPEVRARGGPWALTIKEK